MAVEIPHRSPQADNAFGRILALSEELSGRKWQTAPRAEIIDKVTATLDPKSIGTDDPRLYFLGTRPLFSFVISYREANQALAEDLASPEGFWKQTIEQTTQKGRHDLLDTLFIASAAGTITDVVELSKSGELNSDVSWAQAYLCQNAEAITGARGVVDTISQANGSFGTLYQKRIHELPRIMGQAKLLPEVESEVTRLFAGHILHNFTMPVGEDDNRSLFHIYHDRGRCEGNGLEVSRDLPQWAYPLAWVQSQFEGEERVEVIRQISDKLVKDVAREFEEIKRVHPDRWDGEFIGGIVHFMQSAGLSVEQRREIYEKVPGFLSLPTETQQHMFSSAQFVQSVAQEMLAIQEQRK